MAGLCGDQSIIERNIATRLVARMSEADSSAHDVTRTHSGSNVKSLTTDGCKEWVASIKPNVSTANAAIQLTPNGRFTATNTSLRALILRAYAIHDSQLIGAPDWIAAERFDVDARVEPVPAGDRRLGPQIRRSATTMAQFATALQANVDRPVVDRTGLEGVFDLEYSFAQQPAANTPGGQDNNQPLLLVALEEQLGLKLESRRTAVPGPSESDDAPGSIADVHAVDQARKVAPTDDVGQR